MEKINEFIVEKIGEIAAFIMYIPFFKLLADSWIISKIFGV